MLNTNSNIKVIVQKFCNALFETGFLLGPFGINGLAPLDIGSLASLFVGKGTMCNYFRYMIKLAIWSPF